MFVTMVSESQPCMRGYMGPHFGSGRVRFVAEDRFPWGVAWGGVSGSGMALHREWLCDVDWRVVGGGLGASSRSWVLLGGGLFMVVSEDEGGSAPIICKAGRGGSPHEREGRAWVLGALSSCMFGSW
jgi:hypothetical protein